MKRAALVATFVLAAAAASVTAADALPQSAATDQAAPKKQKVLVGFYKNRTVSYFDYGRIKLRAGNKLALVWVFANGADGQRTIVDSVPGDKQYSALRKVNTVTWSKDATPRVLRSAAAVKAARSSGDVTIKSTSRVVNAPLLGFGQTRHAGFARNRQIHYYELGVVNVAPGNEVLPIWTFTNGVDDQQNIADVVPGTTAYPPLWAVIEVTWKAGAQRRLVRSFEALQQARKAGAVTLKRTPLIVNCPFVEANVRVPEVATVCGASGPRSSQANVRPSITSRRGVADDVPCDGWRSWAAEGQQTLEIEPTQSCANQRRAPADPHE